MKEKNKDFEYTDIELKIVSFEQAESLKEIGFPRRLKRGTLCPCYYNGYFCEDTDSLKVKCGITTPQEPWVKDEYYCSAPTLELVAKWLRDKKKIYVIEAPIIPEYAYDDGNYKFHYTLVQQQKVPIRECGFESWEDALSAGIDKAIEILKN